MRRTSDLAAPIAWASLARTWPGGRALLLAALIGAQPSGAWAGELGPGVAARLQDAGADEFISVIISLDPGTELAALDRSLTARAASRAERHRSVVLTLQEHATRTQEPLLAELERLRARGEVRGFTPYWIANLVVVDVRARTLAPLAQRQEVVRIEPNFQPVLIVPITPTTEELTTAKALREANRRGGSGIAPGLRAIQADRVWRELGVTGEGTIVANLDTGVDGAHVALRDRWRGLHAPAATCWRNYIGVDNTPSDGDRHGTHVMGTMAGLSAETGDTVGVAWGAEWIAANPLLRPLGPSLNNAVIDAFQWMADPDGNPSTSDDVPDVVQNSWGVDATDGHDYSWCDQRWWAAIDNCEAAGVVVTFSAGNSGPNSRTILSPASRADSPTRNFSIGAVDAQSSTFPYPLATFSSRGPSRCPGNAIKPEVIAPGVAVYSSVPDLGGAYAFLSGTSMAGPHVAGVIALMRQVNPDLTAEEIKTILMQTARREGQVEEDNASGHGLVDAWGAVLAAGASFGRVEGQVRFAGGGFVSGATVTVDSHRWLSGPDGRWTGFIPAGEYDIEVRHAELEQRTLDGVAVEVGARTLVDVTLSDRAVPVLSEFETAGSLAHNQDSLAVRVRARDYTSIEEVRLFHRTPGEAWRSAECLPDTTGRYLGWVRDRRIGDAIELRLEVRDGAGNVAREPGAAEAIPLSVKRTVLADNAREDRGWTLGVPGDTKEGAWIRMIPFGSSYRGAPMEPSEDRGGDGYCFVTGKGKLKVEPDRADVDNGCVTLLGPRLDLSAAASASLSYWRWLALALFPADGTLWVEASSDDGATWTTLEELSAPAPSWTQRAFALESFIDLSDAVRIRFVACDDGEDSIVEAAIDDIWVEAEPRPSPQLVEREPFAIAPNPFRGRTFIRFTLERETPVRIEVFDPAGRRIARLRDEVMPAGDHSIRWSGVSDAGAVLASGLYFVRLDLGQGENTQPLLRLK
ncbi:MAG: S8 family serine peptidase [Candidatus Eisenbacteria bacterium]|nr:S8 family serine peptidase [Candidatus Eisenbacteria bacterium]